MKIAVLKKLTADMKLLGAHQAVQSLFYKIYKILTELCYNEFMKQNDLQEAYKHSNNNKTEIMKSNTCGCFYCREIFIPKEIKNWIKDKELTAQCPYCLVDSVIGDASGIPITKAFLDEMHEKWFS